MLVPAPPLVLVFAGSDPTAGAGLQADLLTLGSLGCHGLTVVTALTVQDTAGVERVMPLGPDWVMDQARRLLADMAVSAIKIGLLGSVENAAAVAEVVAEHPDVPLVLDPVLASGRGDRLADEGTPAALRELLVPQSTVVTPNSVEVRRLALAADEHDAPLAACAERLLSDGAAYVLVTGTHERTPQVVNTLYAADCVVREDRWERLPGAYHGSGCTLASAIAALLANGLDVPQAVREAQEYTWQTLRAAFRPGMGQLVPDRFFWARAAGEDDAA
ncbi:MAG: hydroxymethylpyrimidine/phosphomethylpyrimidine kinase [Burkholderiales bacterium]|nr:hydroxymethylpyrimidine/phosphomethylpyrimidine kinase [Burkholderiales bacterium]